jgi:hypothetical protein
MRRFISANGELHISKNSHGILIFSIILAVLLSGTVAINLSPAIHDELLAKYAFYLSPVAFALLANALWFAPVQTLLLISAESISISKRRVFRSSTDSRPMSEVGGFSFTYFTPQKASHRSAARFWMELRSGESVLLLTLYPLSQCKTLHEHMTTFFSGLGNEVIVGDLPN